MQLNEEYKTSLKTHRFQKKFSAQNRDKKIHAEKYFVRSWIFLIRSTFPFAAEKNLFIHIHFPEINDTVHKISPE
jgi:hypothetical protein